MPEAKGVEAVERALQILDCFDIATPSLSLAELARRSGYYKSTILRLAVSLERFGYMVRGEDGHFRLGPTTWKLGVTYRQSFALSEIIRPELKQLSDVTNETASFYVREGNSRICLYRSEPARSIRHSINEGEHMPLDKGASGKVLLAFSDGEPRGNADIKAAGYAISLGERDPEVASISVPVFSSSGTLTGAIAISGLIMRFNSDRHASLIAALKESQKHLADQITT